MSAPLSDDPEGWLGLDVGGANIKAAHTNGEARTVPFALWKRPEDLPALAGMGREVPVGLAVYGDTRLPADYRDNVLVARRGQQLIDRFALERKGAGYVAKEIPWLACPPSRRPMAVTVG